MRLRTVLQSTIQKSGSKGRKSPLVSSTVSTSRGQQGRLDLHAAIQPTHGPPCPLLINAATEFLWTLTSSLNREEEKNGQWKNDQWVGTRRKKARDGVGVGHTGVTWHDYHPNQCGSPSLQKRKKKKKSIPSPCWSLKRLASVIFRESGIFLLSFQAFVAWWNLVWTTVCVRVCREAALKRAVQIPSMHRCHPISETFGRLAVRLGVLTRCTTPRPLPLCLSSPEFSNTNGFVFEGQLQSCHVTNHKTHAPPPPPPQFHQPYRASCPTQLGFTKDYIQCL